MDRSGPRQIHRTRRAARRALTLLALVCGLARCGDTTVTQLLVVVSTEPAEGLPLEAIEVEVQSEDTLTTWDSARFAMVGAADGRFTLPLSFGVVPRVDSPGRVRVTARARLREGAATRSLETSALTTFITGQKLLLPLVLDYRCSLQPPCLPGFSCSAQECVSELRPAATLRAIGPDDAPPATGSTCARPAEACIDRCDEGSRAPVTRFVDRARRTTLATTPEAPPCCGDQSVAARDVFSVSPTPRRDLLPLYICRASDGSTLYSLQQSCEGYSSNVGILGHIVSPATPGRCGNRPPVPALRPAHRRPLLHHARRRARPARQPRVRRRADRGLRLASADRAMRTRRWRLRRRQRDAVVHRWRLRRRALRRRLRRLRR